MSLSSQGVNSPAGQNDDSKHFSKFSSMYKEPLKDPLIDPKTFSSLTEEWGQSAHSTLELLLEIAQDQQSKIEALKQRGERLDAVQQAETLHAIRETNDLLKDWAAVASRCSLTKKKQEKLEKYLEGPRFPNVAKKSYERNKKQGENPIQYMFRIWGKNIVHSNLYLFQLRDLDGKLVRAVYNFCNSNNIISSVFLPPPKSNYASRRFLRVGCKNRAGNSELEATTKETKPKKTQGELTL